MIGRRGMFEVKRIFVIGTMSREERKEREMKVSELIGMKIKEKLFDSEIHKWSKNDSEFGSNLK